jgi:hypothetical protein
MKMEGRTLSVRECRLLQSPMGKRYAVAALLIVGSVGLTGCAGQKLAKVSVCDGKHLRPGNPYGSILPGAPIPPITAPAGPGSPIASIAPRPGAAMTPSASPSVTFASC